MSEEPKGFRAVPPALALAMITWMGFISFRVVLLLGTSEERFWSPRLGLTSEGVGTACYVLALVGALELANKLAGIERLGARIAAAGVGFVLAIDTFSGFLNFKVDIWRHEWISDALQYGYFAGWLVVPVGIAIALWQRNRAVAIGGLVATFLTGLPPPIAKELYKALDLNFKNYMILDSILRVIRTGAILGMFIALARGATTENRAAGAGGLRTASQAMWIRVITALAVVLLTLTAIGGSAGKGSIETLKLAMMTGAIVNLISFVMFGLGVVRTARAAIADMPRWLLAISGGASLWCAGVGFGQLPYLYRMLYKDGGSSYGGMADYTQVLVVAVPVVVIVSAALVAVAIGMFATRRNASDLSLQAQSKGVGFVMMTLAALGITNWMVPKAQSLSSVAMLMLLAAVAGLIATVMLARLCGLAGAEIEREPGLPTASLVSDGS